MSRGPSPLLESEPTGRGPERGRGRRGGCAVGRLLIGHTIVLVCLLALAAPSAVEAATVAVEDGELSVATTAGAMNVIDVSPEGFAFHIHDGVEPVVAREGCVALSPQDAVCGGMITRIRVDGGGGEDLLGLWDVKVPVVARGGDGDDLIETGAGADDIDAGAGQDAVHGRKGDDTLKGGGDRDRIEGGLGDDVLAGEDGADVLRGGRGEDQVSGGNNGDLIDGGKGDDQLAGGEGDNAIVASQGTNIVTTTGGNDRSTRGRGRPASSAAGAVAAVPASTARARAPTSSSGRPRQVGLRPRRPPRSRTHRQQGPA